MKKMYELFRDGVKMKGTTENEEAAMRGFMWFSLHEQDKHFELKRGADMIAETQKNFVEPIMRVITTKESET